MEVEKILSLIYEMEGLLLLYRERGVDALPDSVRKLLIAKNQQVSEMMGEILSTKATAPTSDTDSAEHLAETVEYEQEEDSEPDAGGSNQEEAFLDEAQAEEDEADSENAEIEEARFKDDYFIRKQVKTGNEIMSRLTLNDKFRFAKELFGGSVTALNNVVDAVALFPDLEKVKQYLIEQQGLNPENPATKEFIEILSLNFAH